MGRVIPLGAASIFRGHVTPSPVTRPRALDQRRVGGAEAVERSEVTWTHQLLCSTVVGGTQSDGEQLRIGMSAAGERSKRCRAWRVLQILAHVKKPGGQMPPGRPCWTSDPVEGASRDALWHDPGSPLRTPAVARRLIACGGLDALLPLARRTFSRA